MKTKTKDRLLTAGVVVVICAVGIVIPGCGSVPQRQFQPTTSVRCHTDFECEMLELEHSNSTNGAQPQPRWKVWTAIGLSIAITGWFIAQRNSNGADQRGIDVRTPGVNCDVAGRPGGGCAQ